MAKKKYTNMKLEQQELTPIVIGTLGNKRRGPLGGILLMGLFIAVVIFLPEISEYASKLLNNNSITPSPVTPVAPTPVDPDEPTGNDETFYDFSTSLKIAKDDVELTDFVLDTTNNTLSYSVVNPSKSTTNMEELNYFLEVYDSNRTLLERVKLTSIESLAGGAYQTEVSDINAETASNMHSLLLLKKSESDYPVVELNVNSDNEGSLVCTRGFEEVTYHFNKGLLKNVKHSYNYDNTHEDYNTVYESVNTTASTYNRKTGVTSVFNGDTEKFSVITNVDLESASRTYIFKADTFKLDTEPKVVKFEMEAQNFTCKEG